tara:strand:- start:5165 stop:6052 length:888 start_codon:yes stop_codon:yes gene_type:complete
MKTQISQCDRTIHSAKNNADRSDLNIQEIYNKVPDVKKEYQIKNASSELMDLIEEKIIEIIKYDMEIYLPKNCSLQNIHKFLEQRYMESDRKLIDSVLNHKMYSFSYFLNEILLKQFYPKIRDELNIDFYYQKTPTIRFNFGNSSDFDWCSRFSSIHTDIALGHPYFMKNIWLPITRTFESNSLAFLSFKDSKLLLEESDFNFEKFALKSLQSTFINKIKKKINIFETKKGEYLLFDPRLLHSTQDNKTDHTRVSIDIRIVEKSLLDNSDLKFVGTGRRKLEFIPGEFYSENIFS